MVLKFATDSDNLIMKTLIHKSKEINIKTKEHRGRK